MDNALTPSDLVAQRVRELRMARGMTVAKLAARCAEAGMERLTAQALYKLEGQRSKRKPRPVAVDELLVLAYVLDISPVFLITGLDEDGTIPVTPTTSVTALEARNWMLGLQTLEGTDENRYITNRPPSARGLYARDSDEALEAIDKLRAEIVAGRDLAATMRARREALMDEKGDS